MLKCAKCFVALCFCFAMLLVYAAPSNAQQTSVTAINIALEPDATMLQHAKADNDRLERFSVDVNRNSKGVPKGAQIRFGLF